MKKLSRDDDTYAQPEQRQKNLKTTKGCVMKEGKEPDIVAKCKPKPKAVRMQSTRSAIMTTLRILAQLMKRIRGGN